MRMDNSQATAGGPGAAPISAGGGSALSEDKQGRAEELRLRVGWPMTAVLPQGELSLGTNPVTGRDLEQLLELSSRPRSIPWPTSCAGAT